MMNTTARPETAEPLTLVMEHGTAEFSESTLQALQEAINKTGNPQQKHALEAWHESLSEEAAR